MRLRAERNEPGSTVNVKCVSINMISVITIQGRVRFKVFEDRMNADILIDFMKQLVKVAKRKMFLILDHLYVQNAKITKAWLVEHEADIEVFYLPVYSPKLNPDEN
jgi:transposase